MSSSSFKDLLKQAEQSDDYWTELALIEFREELARLMEEQNVSRAELAKRIGKSPPYITKILNGSGNFTLTTMTKLARAMGTRIVMHLAPRNVTVTWVNEIRHQTPVTEPLQFAHEKQLQVRYINTPINIETSQAAWSH